MACNTETTVIGELEVSVTQWSADKAIINKLKLLKTFGPSIAKLVSLFKEDDGKKTEEETNQEQMDAISQVLELLFNSNEPEQIQALIKHCVMSAAINGERLTEGTYNKYFSGDDLMNIYKVFFFVIRVNYANLLGAHRMEAIVGKMKAIG